MNASSVLRPPKWRPECWRACVYWRRRLSGQSTRHGLGEMHYSTTEHLAYKVHDFVNHLMILDGAWTNISVHLHPPVLRESLVELKIMSWYLDPNHPFQCKCFSTAPMGAPKFSLSLTMRLFLVHSRLSNDNLEYWALHWSWLLWCWTHFLFNILAQAIFVCNSLKQPSIRTKAWNLTENDAT